MDHFYVYSYRFDSDYRRGFNRGGYYVYERTCGTEEGAKDWVTKYGPRAVYLVNFTLNGAFY